MGALHHHGDTDATLKGFFQAEARLQLHARPDIPACVWVVQHIHPRGSDWVKERLLEEGRAANHGCSAAVYQGWTLRCSYRLMMCY
jgi:hypothetical protein